MHSSARFRPLRAIPKSVGELGLAGLVILALFWCMVPFVRTYFYFRDIALGLNPMTGCKTPRLLLAFPFLEKH